ncbi:hypothetical protein [Roseibium aggregatum]|uniref:Uncharacterized protein n=1 Tax=Roseibium aggregatum TaxID=187304 RepID=A0A0M6YFB5_9HYPH|nr:hypothetical protein [Roseibium aggregatum]CTQ47701.1 hypothetical protein LAL4801_06163 [Roseibium aggregatum]
MSKTATERKREQRERDRADGYTEITVKVPVAFSDVVRRQAKQICDDFETLPDEELSDDQSLNPFVGFHADQLDLIEETMSDVATLPAFQGLGDLRIKNFSAATMACLREYGNPFDAEDIPF